MKNLIALILFLSSFTLFAQKPCEYSSNVNDSIGTYKTTKEYKILKGLKKENLRDNMTNTELILNMLAEASTKDISQAVNPKTFDESKVIAKQGGNVAKVALKELEAKTGKKVATGEKFLPKNPENKKLK